MNHCPNCQYENLPTSTFCGHCGVSLAHSSSPLEPTLRAPDAIPPPPPRFAKVLPLAQPQRRQTTEQAMNKKAGPVLYIILGVLVLLLCCVGFLIVRNSSSPPASTQHYHIGYAVNAPPWTVLIDSATTTQQGYVSPSPGETYLIVSIELTNASSTLQNTSSLVQWSLYDLGGTRYNEAIGAKVQTPEGAVAAGATIRGQIAYEVPANLHQFTLNFEPSSGADLIMWDITV